MCAKQTGVLFLSLSGSGRGDSGIYVKGLPTVLEGMGRSMCLTGCTKQCHVFLQISKIFGVFISGWPDLAYNCVYHFAISTFLEPHHLCEVSNHPVISKLMHHFYLQCPPSCKLLIPGILGVCYDLCVYFTLVLVSR